MKKITFFLTLLFVLIFSNQSFSQAETEPNGTVSQSGTQTLTSATTITGAVLPFPDGADFWNINGGVSGSLIATWSDTNIKVSYVGYSDSGRSVLSVPSTAMTSGVPVTLNSSIFYSVSVSFDTFQSGTFNYSVDLSGAALPLACSAPTTQATSPLFGAETMSTLTLNSFIAPAGGADGYAIYINDTNSFTAPIDGDEPTADTSWNGSGQQPIYFGTSATPNVTVTGLDANTTYYYRIYAYNDCSSTETYETTGLSANDATINTPPTFTSTPITSVDDGDTYSYIIETDDADGDNVIITAPTKPSWLSLTSNGLVSTLAGSGNQGGVNGIGTAATFRAPWGVATDASGNVYVADTYNSRIRKITPGAVVTTFAGSSVGYQEGTGTGAKFNLPTGIAVDATGNLFVADVNNHRIRKITPAGVVSTFAGSGSIGSDDARGISASFHNPYGIAIDASGNLYIADTNNHKIRKITPAGDVTTLAGSVEGFADGTGAAAQFNNPSGVTVDASGNVYVTDNDNHRVRKISPSGEVSTLAGSGTAGNVDGTGAAASFDTPSGCVVDASGNVYVSDSQNHLIRKISPGGEVSTIAGTGNTGNTNGIGSAASFNVPYGISINANGDLFVADITNNLIRKIIPNTIGLTGDSSGHAGDHNVVLTANDGNGGSVNQSFTITVNDVTDPSVIEVGVVESSGSYKIGDVLQLFVQYDESVIVTGTPQLTVETGTTDRIVNYTSTSSSTVYFNYTIQSGDINNDLDLVSSGNFNLNGGTIKDASGNDASLVLPVGSSTSGSISNGKDIVVDGILPTGTITTPIEIDNVVTSAEDDHVVISGTISEAVTSGLVTVEFDDGVNSAIQTAAVVSGNTWTSPTTDISSLNEGNITVRAIASDLAGNTSTFATETIVLENINRNVTLSVGSSNITENGGTSIITATLDKASVLNVTVNLAYTGTAINGTDYNSTASTAIVIPAGSTIANAAVGITAIDDALVESDETIIIDIASVTNGVEDGTQQKTITILNDDISTIEFSSASSSGAESNGNSQLEVSLSKSSTKVITINYAVTGGNATGNGTDYTLTDGTLTFNPGDVTKNITIASIVDDLLDEENETIILTLSNPTNATLGSQATHTYTINDNDTPPTVAFTSTTSSGAESNTSANLQVDLSTFSGKDVTVDYTVTGTATGSGTDYTLADGTLTITAGSSSNNITIASIIGDVLDEFDETVIVTLSNPVNATLGANTVHTYTIFDDDATPTVSFTSTSSSGLESVSSGNLQVTLSTVSSKDVTVDYTVSGTAINGTDYTLSNGTLIISGGNSSNNITIGNIVDDLLDEFDETVIVTLSNPTNATFGANTVHTYTINDNDALPTVSFALATDAQLESESSQDVQVSLNAVSGRTVTVDYTVTGSATSGGVDHTTTGGTIIFNPGDQDFQQQIVGIVDDLLDEENETIILTLSNPTNATLGSQATHTYTITDNDEPPTVVLSSSSNTIGESGGSSTLTATLSSVSARDVTVVLGLSGTAVNSTDYTISTTSILISAGSTSGTSTITMVDDTVSELNETIVVDVVSVTNGTENGTQQQTISIIDDDAPVVTGVSLSQSSGVLKLGDQLDLTVTFSSSVTITGIPSVPLQIGSSTLQAPLNGTVTGSTTAVFRYTVSTGDIDVDGIAVGSAINLNGGTIKESTQGNDAILTLNNTDNPGAITVDGIVPTVSIASTVSDPTNSEFDVTITFSEAPVGFTVSDITVVNGVASNLQGSGTIYTATITPSTDNQVEVSIASEVFTDAAGNANTGSNTITTNYDGTKPEVTISTSTSTTNTAFTATITFSESVTGFELSDLVVGNGVASNLQGSGTEYTATITPINDGNVTLDVAENVANDTATNGNTAAAQHTVLYDATRPTVSIASTVSNPTNSEFDVTITFSESVTGLELSDIDVGNGVASNLQGSGTTYTATITPSSDGSVIVFIPENVANDAAGNGNDISNEFSVGYDATSPTVMLSTTAPNPTNSPFTVAISFSEAVLGFEMDDLIVTNGTPSSFTGSGASYSVLITPTEAGLVMVDVIEGVAEDAAGNENTAGTLELEFDNIAPYPPQITHISDYTCSGTVAMTGDNTLEISGTAERQSTVEVFIDGVSIGTVVADANTGFFTFDYTSTALADGSYTFTARATDISTNTGDLSAPFSITINTVDSDGDGTPDFCDDDNGNNGEVDAEEDCDGDGIINSQDSDNSTCREPIDQTRTYGFSPNGDGINEGWVIENIEAFPNNTVSVFSRSGKLVFKEKGYKNTWQGDSNQINSNGLGKKLPVGPYIYVIDLGDGGRPIRGWLYINY